MKKESQEKNDNKKEDVKENDENIIKRGFFKKIGYSIYKIEKYSELSAEGFLRALKYFVNLVIILAIIVSGTTLFKVNKEVINVVTYVKNEISDFSYSDKTLKMDSQEVIRKEDENLGKIIIDVNQDNEDEINKYIESISANENGIVILKNKVILKEAGMNGTINYSYEDLFSKIGLTEFNKQQLIDYMSSSKILSIYFNLFIVLFMYAFTIYFVNIIIDIFLISIFGFIASLITKLKIKYVAIFNMAVYSTTLAILLDAIYIVVNSLFNYSIKYFDVMFILVSTIYMFAAIFMIKSDFIKKQQVEVTKIVEVEKQIKDEMNKKDKEKEDKPKEQTKKPKTKNKEEDNKDDKEEPEGSNA